MHGNRLHEICTSNAKYAGFRNSYGRKLRNLFSGDPTDRRVISIGVQYGSAVSGTAQWNES